MHLEKVTEVLFNVFYVFLAFFLPLMMEFIYISVNSVLL